MARLIVGCEGVDLLTHELAGDIIMIGRAPANHIVIDHLTVSAQHAVLLRVGASYWLNDLNSTNGTLINGVLATDAELNDGDKIRFGFVGAVFTGRFSNEGQDTGLEDSGRLFRSKPDAVLLIV
jgi:pSer/pThr/pTyr-binding forkhead associated (FHA) protein